MFENGSEVRDPVDTEPRDMKQLPRNEMHVYHHFDFTQAIALIVITVLLIALTNVMIKPSCIEPKVSGTLTIEGFNKPQVKDSSSKDGEVVMPERPTLGVMVRDISDDERNYFNIPNGVFVEEVLKDSGAERAGIKKGDYILEVEGVETPTVDDVLSVLETHNAGDYVEVKFATATEGSYGFEIKRATVKLH